MNPTPHFDLEMGETLISLYSDSWWGLKVGWELARKVVLSYDLSAYFRLVSLSMSSLGTSR